MIRMQAHPDRSVRAQRLIARARHKQLHLARSGRVEASAAWARRATQLRQVVQLHPAA